MKLYHKRILAIAGITLMVNYMSSQVFEIKMMMKKIESGQGEIFTGEWGEIEVPEVYGNDDSKRIMLPFFRMKAQSKKNELPSVFILPGGPGDTPSVLEQLDGILPMVSSINFRSDLIILGQRGNVLSRPNLSCEGFLELPLDIPLTEELFSKEYIKYIRECSASFKAKKQDLEGYTVSSMVEDVESVRKALGYHKIMLFGGSFGSHHALAYINKYSIFVDRAILDSPEGLNHTTKLPVNTDKMLMKLSALVAKDPILSNQIPNFIELVDEVLDGLEKSPVTVPLDISGTLDQTSIVIGKYDLQLVTAIVLGRTGYRELPQRYMEMKAGNYQWLANNAYQIRNFQNRNLMSVLTDCSSRGSLERFKLVNEQSKVSILGDAMNNVNFKACDLFSNKTVKMDLEESRSEVPMLLIVGSQDARTPPENAYEIKKLHSNAKILLVQHASHDLFNEAYDLIEPFIKGYLESDNALDYEIPAMIEAPLNLRIPG